jgi:hypothetical protein
MCDKSAMRRFRSLYSLMGVVLMLALSGGPWLALQTVAWARMLVAYSQPEGLWQGVIKTFNGENPCSLCQSIRQATSRSVAEQEKSPSAVPSETVWAAVLAENAIRFDAVCPSRFAVRHEVTEDLSFPPPTPPPRA